MRITIPEDHVAVLLPTNLAQDLYSLCNLIRKTRRLKIEPPIHAVAGEVMLALLASEEIVVLPAKGTSDD